NEVREVVRSRRRIRPDARALVAIVELSRFARGKPDASPPLVPTADNGWAVTLSPAFESETELPSIPTFAQLYETVRTFAAESVAKAEGGAKPDDESLARIGYLNKSFWTEDLLKAVDEIDKVWTESRPDGETAVLAARVMTNLLCQVSD